MSQLLDSLVSRLRETFDPAAIGTVAGRWIVNLALAVVVLLAFYAFWRVLLLPLRYLFRRIDLDRTTSAFVETLAKFGIMTVAVIAALDTAGIATAPLLASVGLAGITIGFAARDALSNIISGVLIYLDRPFTINDLVEVEGSYGRVDRITLRSTRVVTPDGRMLAVPNSQVINNTVASYTNFPNLRLDVAVNIATTEDLGNTRRVLLGLVAGDPDYLTEPPPRVVVTKLNDDNVELELRAWIRDERSHLTKRLELREKIYEALNRAGVQMPFRTLQLAPFEARLAQR